MIKQRLFTPGPTDVPPEVLIEMARPIFHHRTARFREMFAEVTAGPKKILKTENDVLTIAGSGTAGMGSPTATASCRKGRSRHQWTFRLPGPQRSITAPFRTTYVL